jgi:hypothetical protein
MRTFKTCTQLQYIYRVIQSSSTILKEVVWENHLQQKMQKTSFYRFTTVSESRRFYVDIALHYCDRLTGTPL